MQHCVSIVLAGCDPARQAGLAGLVPRLACAINIQMGSLWTRVSWFWTEGNMVTRDFTPSAAPEEEEEMCVWGLGGLLAALPPSS